MKMHLEDIAVGDQFKSQEYALDATQIIEFALRFDPQPFHLDELAAKDLIFQGLAASGWHTAAITMRLLVSSLPFSRGVIGAGAEISWPRPTRPGDVLHAVSTICEINPSRSKDDRGIVLVETLTLNQRSEVCQRLLSKVLVFRRPTA